MRFIHLWLVLADDEPGPVHGDGDHSQRGHEGRQTGNSTSQSGKSKFISLFQIWKSSSFIFIHDVVNEI